MAIVHCIRKRRSPSSPQSHICRVDKRICLHEKVLQARAEMHLHIIRNNNCSTTDPVATSNDENVPVSISVIIYYIKRSKLLINEDLV